MRALEVDQLNKLEAQENVARHLQISIDKPCAAAYLNCSVLPEIGMRSILFYALAQELRRIGQSKEQTIKNLSDLYNKLPSQILNAPGQDGAPFTIKEVNSAVNSAYRSEDIKSYGCNSEIWNKTCPGSELCQLVSS